MSFPTRADVESRIATAIDEDPGFRERLLADPRGVVGELIGMDIPENVTVVLHEESLTHIHLTIPASDEIAEHELELVAGGRDNLWRTAFD